MPISNLKIVPDTGFYIAAALQNGYARNYLIGRGSKFLTYRLFISEAILLETQGKLEQKFHFDRATTASSIKQIRKVTTVVHPTRKVEVVRDPDDNKILECALEAKADIIVSFDKDLLQLKEFENIQIVHPSMLKFWFQPKL